MLKAKTRIHLSYEEGSTEALLGKIEKINADLYFNEQYVQGMIVFMEDDEPYIEIFLTNGLTITAEYEEKLFNELKLVL